MSLIRIDNVTKSFSGDVILDGVSFRVEEGQKIGLIGRNGTGKSTLFRIMTREIEPDSGAVERMRRARFASLAQLPRFETEDTIHDVVMRSFHELLTMEEELRALEEAMAKGDNAAMEKYASLQDTFMVRGGYEFRAKAKQVLHGLGFREEDYGLSVTALSGGQRTRLMLALVLLEDADLLLLDEPENHLDLEAREWLEDFLKGWPRAFVMISHDRHMLNAVVEYVAEVERGSVYQHKGNYDAFQAHKQLLREQQQKAYERQQEYIAKEQTFINRFRYKATKASEVQSRIKRLEKLERIEPPLPEGSQAKFNLGEAVRSGQVVLRGEGLGMRYGALELYADLSFEVERGERLGIIGPNGCGKTTLMRQLAGRLEGGEGAVALGHKVRMGVYEQHHESFNPEQDVLSAVQESAPSMTPGAVRSFLGRFLFTGDDVFKPVRALSGGELARVALARLILSGANLLLLDEPTNHLDIASREALENALDAFPGTLVMVSHDRALIDRLVTKLLVMEDGPAVVYPGNYSQYRWKQAQGAQEEAAAARGKDDVMKVRRGQDADRKRSAGRDQRKRRKELEQLEQTIEAMEQEVAGYEQQFTDLDPADYETAQRLKEEYDALKARLEEAYEQWAGLTEEVAQ